MMHLDVRSDRIIHLAWIWIWSSSDGLHLDVVLNFVTASATAMFVVLVTAYIHLGAAQCKAARANIFDFRDTFQYLSKPTTSRCLKWPVDR